MPGPLEASATGIDHLQHLQQFEKSHKLDPNLPIDDLNDVDAAIATGNAEKGIEIEHALMEDNSPYPEVRPPPPPPLFPPALCLLAPIFVLRPASTARLDVAAASSCPVHRLTSRCPRCAPSFATTTSMSPPTPSGPGSSACSSAPLAPVSTCSFRCATPVSQSRHMSSSLWPTPLDAAGISSCLTGSGTCWGLGSI